jgi:glycosyltransferase involved in cell wall biosynthesis
MRILIINWQDITNPLGGGAEVHLHNIFSRVARLGHEVTLLCSGYPGAPATEMRDGLTIIRRGGRSTFNVTALLSYLREFRSQPFDVVVDDLNKIPFLTPLFVRKPLVGIAHHLFGASIYREVNAAVASYVYGMERLGLLVYRLSGMPFFVVSPSTQKEFEDLGFAASRLHLVHNCVDHVVHHAAPERRSATPVIGVVGRMKRYKCVDHVLQAMPAVLKAVPDARLLMVGDGDDRPRLQDLVHTLGINGAVTFTGYVSEGRKVELLQQMWFSVTTSSKEGWGLTVLEANACGTPVIAADVPGLRDAVKDGVTGVLVPFGDVPVLEKQMLALLGNGARRDQLTNGALAWAAEFNWDNAATKTIALLEDVVRTHNSKEEGKRKKEEGKRNMR